MNENTTYHVLQACIDAGAREFIICAGSRNSSFVEALRVEERITTYYWPEERSAAFFALGRTRATGRPVPVVVTSGTAAAELFPATIEAYYSGDPLILITADRPRYFRGSGAPQSAEQDRLFGRYTKVALDIADDEPCNLSHWDRLGPLQINVCLEEPQSQPQFTGRQLNLETKSPPISLEANSHEMRKRLDKFLSEVRRPLAIVSTLHPKDREPVAQLLIKLGMPAMIEGISGLREDPRLQMLALKRTDKVLEDAEENGYPIDGVLRIGGIPTHRIWRDLEYRQDAIKVCGLSRLPYSGLSWSRQVIQGSLPDMLQNYLPARIYQNNAAAQWLTRQNDVSEKLIELMLEEPLSEPALIHSLSKIIPYKASIYLGNSLPIREWDLAAERTPKDWTTNASRGVNGIDGQISTFLGTCTSGVSNWGLFGDLTALYDMVGYWILPNIEADAVNIVVINNGGGKIFERMFPYKEMQNLHKLSFRPLAEMWGLEYAAWNAIPSTIDIKGRRLIEILPDDDATSRFWKQYAIILDSVVQDAKAMQDFELESLKVK